MSTQVNASGAAAAGSDAAPGQKLNPTGAVRPPGPQVNDDSAPAAVSRAPAGQGNTSSNSNSSQPNRPLNLPPRVVQNEARHRVVSVANLPREATFALLKDTFAQVAKVVSGGVGPRSDGTATGLLTFETQADAERAVSEFNGVDLGGRPMQLTLYAAATNIPNVPTSNGLPPSSPTPPSNQTKNISGLIPITPVARDPNQPPKKFVFGDVALPSENVTHTNTNTTVNTKTNTIATVRSSSAGNRRHARDEETQPVALEKKKQAGGDDDEGKGKDKNTNTNTQTKNTNPQNPQNTNPKTQTQTDTLSFVPTARTQLEARSSVSFHANREWRMPRAFRRDFPAEMEAVAASNPVLLPRLDQVDLKDIVDKLQGNASFVVVASELYESYGTMVLREFTVIKNVLAKEAGAVIFIGCVGNTNFRPHIILVGKKVAGLDQILGKNRSAVLPAATTTTTTTDGSGDAAGKEGASAPTATTAASAAAPAAASSADDAAAPTAAAAATTTTTAAAAATAAPMETVVLTDGDFNDGHKTVNGKVVALVTQAANVSKIQMDPTHLSPELRRLLTAAQGTKPVPMRVTIDTTADSASRIAELTPTGKMCEDGTRDKISCSFKSNFTERAADFGPSRIQLQAAGNVGDKLNTSHFALAMPEVLLLTEARANTKATVRFAKGTTAVERLAVARQLAHLNFWVMPIRNTLFIAKGSGPLGVQDVLQIEKLPVVARVFTDVPLRMNRQQNNNTEKKKTKKTEEPAAATKQSKAKPSLIGVNITIGGKQLVTLTPDIADAVGKQFIAAIPTLLGDENIKCDDIVNKTRFAGIVKHNSAAVRLLLPFDVAARLPDCSAISVGLGFSINAIKDEHDGEEQQCF